MPIVTPAANLSDRLGQMRLPDSNRKPVILRTLWADRTVILVHVNSFGSLSGSEQVQAVLDAMPDLEAVGLTLAVIGAGEARAGADFIAKFPRPFPVLLDPDFHSFEIIGDGHRKSARRATPSAFLAEVKLLRKGSVSGVSGPKAQVILGATHVIRAGGEVLLAWLNDKQSGACPTSEVLAALDADSEGLAPSDEGYDDE